MQTHSHADNGGPFGVIDFLPDELAVDVLFIKIIGDADFKVCTDPLDAKDRNGNNRGKLKPGNVQRAVLLEQSDRAAFFVSPLVGKFQG